MEIKRGDIYYIEKNPTYYAVGSEQYASRPAIIVSCKGIDQTLRLAQVVYLTTQPKHDAPSHVMIRSQERNCVALCEQIFTVSLDRVKNYMGKITEQEQKVLDAALMAQLGLTAAPAEPKEDALEQVLQEIRQLRQEIRQETKIEQDEQKTDHQKRNTIYSEIGKIIVDYRNQHNLSAEEFAIKAGVSSYTVACVIALSHKRQTNFKKPTLLAIAHACEIYGEEADRLIEMRMRGE